MEPNERAYEAYLYYLALKRHFTSDSYDFFKYNGRVKSSRSAFVKKKQNIFFYNKLSHITDYKKFLLANFSQGNAKVWIGDLVRSDEYMDLYKNWMKYDQSKSYQFQKQLKPLIEQYGSIYEICRSIDGNFPVILDEYLQKNIDFDTLVMLDKYLNVFDALKENFTHDPVFSDINRRCAKYKGFVQSNNKVIKNFILENLK